MTRRDRPAPPDARIREEKSRQDFIFFVVDVINSSRLFKTYLDDPHLRQHDEVLNRLHDHVLKSFGLKEGSGYEWNWAGDGGLLAFPAGVLGTTDYVLDCARKVANFKSGKCKEGCGPFDLQLRMVLDRGEAYYNPTKGLVRSGALNFAAKLRLPGERTSLTVTHEVYKHLDGFAKLRAFRPLASSDGRTIYGYVPLMVRGLSVEIEKQAASDCAQAAHLAYRLGVLQFSEGQSNLAVAAFDRCLELLNKITARHRYFYRTLCAFYRLWRTLAADASKELLHHKSRRDPLTMLRSDEFKKFSELSSRNAWQLLIEMEVIIEQLDVLAGNPVNDPVGLTSLEICLLLERVGYPRRWFGPAVHNRLERIKADMAADPKGENTVDEGCSMCSAVAASCLLLNGDHEKAGLILAWMRDLKHADYCWRRVDRFSRAEPDDHAFNYAAMVFQAFVDHGIDFESSDVTMLADLFLNDVVAGASGFPARWTDRLTTSIYDFSTYVFPALARYRLAKGTFGTDDRGVAREAVVRDALRALVTRLQRDAAETGLNETEVGRSYAARENVGALALGQLIENFPDADTILEYNLQRLAKYATANDIPPAVRARTMDSNLDRVRKMLEGWLLLFETVLYRREKDWSIPSYVTDALGIAENTVQSHVVPDHQAVAPS